jgi:hypothetical protein
MIRYKAPAGMKLRRGLDCISLHLPIDKRRSEPGLALVVECWDRLPEAIKAGIVAMVQSSAKGGDV